MTAPAVAITGEALGLGRDLLGKIPDAAPRTRTGTLADKLARDERAAGRLDARAIRARRDRDRLALEARAAAVRRAIAHLVDEREHAQAIEEKHTESV